MILRYVLVSLAAVFFYALIVGPYLVPISPLQGTKPHRLLAEPDSEFVTVKGVEIHVKTAGQLRPDKPVVLLAHGFGASVFSWQQIMKPLAEESFVIAWDRPGFGLTERPLQWQKWNPYSPAAQVDIALALMEHFDVHQVVAVGHSAGGRVAARLSIDHPDSITGLVLIGPAIWAGDQQGSGFSWLLSLPQVDRLGPWFVRSISESGNDTMKRAWHDPAKLTEATVAAYRKPLGVNHWDKGLWYFTQAARKRMPVYDELHELSVPVAVMTGDDDRLVATANSIALSRSLEAAGVEVQESVFESCGHVPQEECPEETLEALTAFLRKLQ